MDEEMSQAQSFLPRLQGRVSWSHHFKEGQIILSENILGVQCFNHNYFRFLHESMSWMIRGRLFLKTLTWICGAFQKRQMYWKKPGYIFLKERRFGFCHSTCGTKESLHKFNLMSENLWLTWVCIVGLTGTERTRLHTLQNRHGHWTLPVWTNAC